MNGSPSSTVALLPVAGLSERVRSLKKGLVGKLAWRATEANVESPAHDDQWQTWEIAIGQLAGKGPVDAHLATEGWSVCAMTAGRRLASHVAKILDDHVPNGFREVDDVGDELAARLFWDLIPQTAFIAYHNRTRELCLARDVLGFIPLYYQASSEGVVLSSSLPWILEMTRSAAINVGKLSEIISFGHHFGSSTVWSGVDVVAPGQCVVVAPGDSVRRYWFARPEVAFNAEERKRLSSLSTEQLLASSRKLVEKSLSTVTFEKNFVVQGGGGVDSSVLTALASKLRPDVVAWSINHPDLDPCEASWVEPLAARLRVRSELSDVTRNAFLSNLVDVMVRSAQPLIGPNFIGGAILRQQALQSSPDDLSFLNGELCDTIFGGLSSFHQLAKKRLAARKLSRLPANVRRMVRRGTLDDRDWLSSRIVGLPEKEFALAAFGSLERAELIEEVHTIGETGDDSVQTLADQLTWFDFRRVPSALHHGFYERDEWYGGQFLFPFADQDLLRFGFNLPCKYKYRSGHTKWLWRNLAAELVGNDVAFRPKKGFDAPIGKWLAPVLPMLVDGFVSDAFRLSRRQFARQLAENEALLWPLVDIELWGRLHCWAMHPDELIKKLLG